MSFTLSVSESAPGPLQARDYVTIYGKIGLDRFNNSKSVPGDSKRRNMVGLKNLSQVKRLVG